MVRKALVITYGWPPYGGPGVQRWLKFCKYMPEYGWQPVVYHPENPAIPFRDESLAKDIPEEAEILHTSIRGPSEWVGALQAKLGKASGQPASGAGSGGKRFQTGNRQAWLRWLKGMIYNPDYNIFWVRPSVRFLSRYLEDNPVEVMITSGPPHSMHLIGLGLKRRFPGLPWVADFRDPWVEMDSLQERLGGSRFLLRQHRTWEKRVVNACDHLLATSPGMIDALPCEDTTKYKVITNGFDRNDFLDLTPNPPRGKFTLFHAGRINELRNPDRLWLAMAELLAEDADFRSRFELTLAGNVAPVILDEIQRRAPDHFRYLGYIPHGDLPRHLADASALLLLANRSPLTNPCIPGKVFEYFAVGSPILALTPPEADVRGLIEAYPRGHWSGYSDTPRLKSLLLQLVKEPPRKDAPASAFVAQYERKALTRELCAWLERIGSEVPAV